MLHAGVVDPLDGRVALHVDLEPGRIEHLRHQAHVGHGRRVAVAEGAGLRPLVQRRFVSVETGFDPVARPGEGALLGLAELFAQIAHDPQILDRMDIGTHDQRKRPHLGPADWIAGQQRRLRMRLLEILHDRQRLGKHGPIVQHECRHQFLRVQRNIVGSRLLTLAQMPRRMLDLDSLEVKRNAYAERRGRPEIADKLHDRLPRSL